MYNPRCNTWKLRVGPIWRVLSNLVTNVLPKQNSRHKSGYGYHRIKALNILHLPYKEHFYGSLLGWHAFVDGSTLPITMISSVLLPYTPHCYNHQRHRESINFCTSGWRPISKTHWRGRMQILALPTRSFNMPGEEWTTDISACKFLLLGRHLHSSTWNTRNITFSPMQVLFCVGAWEFMLITPCQVNASQSIPRCWLIQNDIHTVACGSLTQ